MTRRKYMIGLESRINTFVYLYNAADLLLDNAQEKKEGRFYNCMCANLMLAFCVEAYLNHACEGLVPYWDEGVKKDLSISSKLHIIESLLKKNFDYSKRPYQSIKDILKFRSLLVHAKTERLKEERVQYIEDKEFPAHTKLWWEKKCAVKVTKSWFEDTKLIITDLYKAEGKSSDPFLIASTHDFQAHPL